MRPHLLLDTHAVVRWLVEPRRLTRDQARALREAVRNRQPVGIGGISLLEIALLEGLDRKRLPAPPRELLAEIDRNPVFQILPISVEVAMEVATLGPRLRDPADRAIVATARVHALRLVTSDQRIIDSGLVPVVA
ncbi:MAG TPA: type II toxin-antitoxin system VapC family toxin [Bryobacteraceae bacterium]|nr:type II toxin-antitoxin system VapC family toxin [Bryobacteraceae bacterium]